MARFRAYSSDDSDDDDNDGQQQNGNASDENPFEDDANMDANDDDEQEEEDEDEESNDEESDSIMQEDELMPLPKKTALVADDDGDYDVVSPQRERSAPPQMGGVDPQRVRLMQTSLFRMPEEAENMRAMMNMPEQRSLRVLKPNLNRKHSRDSDGDGMRIDAREVCAPMAPACDCFHSHPEQRASFAHDIEPPAYRPSRKYARVATSSSAFQGHDEAAVDAGLSFGRSFRVGWGPGGMIAHLGSLTGPSRKS